MRIYSNPWVLLRTLGFYSITWDFTPTPGVLLQTVGFYTKTSDFTPNPGIYSKPWDFTPNPGILLQTFRGLEGVGFVDSADIEGWVLDIHHLNCMYFGSDIIVGI